DEAMTNYLLLHSALSTSRVARTSGRHCSLCNLCARPITLPANAIMDSSGDSYKQTIDYIQQIEKEIAFNIDFTLDDGHLELDSGITSNTYCDILLEKISKELDITSDLEKNHYNSDLCLNGNAAVANNNSFVL